jgi:hypothetical protein
VVSTKMTWISIELVVGGPRWLTGKIHCRASGTRQDHWQNTNFLWLSITKHAKLRQPMSRSLELHSDIP